MANVYGSPLGAGNKDGSAPEHAYDKAGIGTYLNTDTTCSDILTLLDGSYVATSSDYMWYVRRRGIDAANQFTIQAQNPRLAIIDGDYLPYAPILLNKNGLSYVKFIDLKITGGQHSGIHCANSTWESNGGWYYHHISIIGCEYYDIGQWAYTGNNGMGAGGTPCESDNWLWDKCLFHDIGRTTYVNDWHDQILMLLGNAHIVRNCIFYPQTIGWSGACVSIEAQYQSYTARAQGDNIKILHNTFTGAARANRPGHITIAWQSNDQLTGVVIANNISKGALRAFVWPYSWTGSLSRMGDVSILNNVTNTSSLYTNGLPDTYWTDADPGLVATGNVLSVDPGFVDQAGHDFTLVSESPALNIAHATYLADDDYAGDSRPLPAASDGDAGAYEMDEGSTGGDPEGNEITGLAEILAVHYEVAPPSPLDWLSLRTTTRTRVAQKFQASGAHTVSQVKFTLKRTGSATGNAYAKLYATSGMPTTELATSSALDASTVPLTETEYIFTFTTPHHS